MPRAVPNCQIIEPATYPCFWPNSLVSVSPLPPSLHPFNPVLLPFTVRAPPPFLLSQTSTSPGRRPLRASYHIHLNTYRFTATYSFTTSSHSIPPSKTQAPVLFHCSLHGMFNLRCSSPREYAASPSCHWLRSRVSDEPCRIIDSRWISSLLLMRC